MAGHQPTIPTSDDLLLSLKSTPERFEAEARLLLATAGFIRMASSHDPRRADLLSDLDRGQADAIALAQERRASRQRSCLRLTMEQPMSLRAR